jgi:hypothetical protein
MFAKIFTLEYYYPMKPILFFFSTLFFLHLIGAAPQAKGYVMTESKRCTKIWTEKDSEFESKGMFETISFSRTKKEIKWRVHKWSPDGRDQSKEMIKALGQVEFHDLDQFLDALCLEHVVNEPPPPSGGPADIVVKSRTNSLRLGWKGNTGGDYFLLTPENLRILFDKLHEYGPRSVEAKSLPKHPGIIITIEEPGSLESKKSIADIPLRHQYVFLKDGKEVDSATDADTIIPIVKVKALRSPDRKEILEIQELGPEGQSLSRTYGAR